MAFETPDGTSLGERPQATRVVPSALDHRAETSGVQGDFETWYPTTQAAVAETIGHLRGVLTIVRSGGQVADDNIVNGDGGAVINLSGLTMVTVQDNLVTAEVGGTVGDLTARLVQAGLALPIGDNSQHSIASFVLKNWPSYLMRTLGSMEARIDGVVAAGIAGERLTFDASGGPPVGRARDAKAVLLEVRFTATSAEALWMKRWTLPYPGVEGFLAIAQRLFVGSSLPANTDLVLDAYPGRQNMPFLTISAICNQPANQAALERLVESAQDALVAIRGDLKEFIRVEEPVHGAAVLSAILDEGHGIPDDPTFTSRWRDQVVPRDGNLGAFLGGLAEEVHNGIGFSPNPDEGEIDPTVKPFTRLQLNREGALVVCGLVHTVRTVAAEGQVTAPLQQGQANLSAAAKLGRATSAPEALQGGATVMLTPTRAIPGFIGEIYLKGDVSYAEHAHQYATSSFPSAEMSPAMVAYPVQVADISAAIQFASETGMRVVARSGGHSYCGKSSGGDDTIVLAMDLFNHVAIDGNIAEVGPAVQLTELAKLFKAHGITIPHGECPLVNIGGHAQTGGYGHLLRSFGLGLDYVSAFNIVLADGVEREIKRPGPGVVQNQDDNELFWGVLGGNAGSFGIMTRYKFECIKDQDHQNSYGFAAKRQYTRERFAKLMKLTQDWTRMVENGDLPEGIDFTMTVESRSGLLPFPLLLVETVNANLDGASENVNGDVDFADIISAVEPGLRIWEIPLTTQGTQLLSSLSDSFVRRHPATTKDGRELKYPFKKRLNATMAPLTDNFVAGFVDLVDNVIEFDGGVYLVFQMIIGGGAFRKSERRPATSIPLRDLAFGFVFDLFYDEGFEGAAEDFQNQMQRLIDDSFNNGRERHLFWGCFGDTDLARPDVQQMYYDNDDDYARLQRLKAKVDPDDVFRTSLTVKRPKVAQVP